MTSKDPDRTRWEYWASIGFIFLAVYLVPPGVGFWRLVAIGFSVQCAYDLYQKSTRSR